MADFFDEWGAALAPILSAAGPLLGGAVGGPAGAVVGGILGKGLAAALGTEATPAAVAAAVQADPAKASAALAKVAADPAAVATISAAEAAEIRRMEIANASADAARAHTLALVDKGSPMAWGAALMSLMIVAGFLALTGALMFRRVPDSQVALVLFGTLSTSFGAVVNYWIGSSAGSRAKDDTIRESMQGKLEVAAEAVGSIVRQKVRGGR
jgi:hypothetical protein